MTDDEHRINRVRDDSSDDQFECEECGETYPTEERLRRHRERKTREKLRGSPVGDALLEIHNQRRRQY